MSGFLTSSTWASSLYVIAEAASISPFRNAIMSKFCLTTVTSLSGSMPFLTSAARCSNSLPRIQTPNFLPRIFLNVLMPLALNVTSVVPERA